MKQTYWENLNHIFFDWRKKQDTSETFTFENTVNEESDDFENAVHTKGKEHNKCKLCTRESECVPCIMQKVFSDDFLG